MAEDQSITFGPFTFDPVEGRLWHDAHDLRLQPKTAAVLHYLATHPGRLITRQELLRHIWPDTSVTSTALRVRVRELRVALGDNVEAPQYIETVGRQGYRFLGGRPLDAPSGSSPVLPAVPAPFVGRQHEMAHLQRLFRRAAQGARQLVLISGEAGIGKTTVVDQFVARMAHQDALWIGRGQGVEHYGEREPYLGDFRQRIYPSCGSVGPAAALSLQLPSVARRLPLRLAADPTPAAIR